MRRIKLFYSYSHKDESYREELENHLSILRKNGYISEWHDRRISAGNEWEEDINFNLEEADIILLLVSSNFLASDYCYDTETIRALEKHKSKEAVVIPVVLSPCLWLESKLSELQSLPRDNKPISTFDNKDVAWLEVAKGILEKVKKIQGSRSIKGFASKPGKTNEGSCELILSFLKEYNIWYFSPLRIQKWGAQRPGFELLATYSAKEIRACLESYKRKGEIRTTKSQKGNTIYKIQG
jgi:hypothetical protein